MKKFINEPANLVEELLEGLVLAFPDKVQLGGRNIVARAVLKESGKVRLVTLGGSGHEPGLSGFVGKGMLDYSVAGDIFAAPKWQALDQYTAKQAYTAVFGYQTFPAFTSNRISQSYIFSPLYGWDWSSFSLK